MFQEADECGHSETLLKGFVGFIGPIPRRGDGCIKAHETVGWKGKHTKGKGQGMAQITVVVVPVEDRKQVVITEVDSDDMRAFRRLVDGSVTQLSVPRTNAAALMDEDKTNPVNTRATAFVKSHYGAPGGTQHFVPLRGNVVFVGAGTLEWTSCPPLVINSLMEFSQL